MPRSKDEARGINGPPLRKLATMAARKTARPPESENVSDNFSISSSSDESISSSSSDDESRCEEDMAYDSLKNDMREMMRTLRSLSMTAKLDLDYEAISQKVNSIMEALQETQDEADKKRQHQKKEEGALGTTKEESRRSLYR